MWGRQLLDKLHYIERRQVEQGQGFIARFVKDMTRSGMLLLVNYETYNYKELKRLKGKMHFKLWCIPDNNIVKVVSMSIATVQGCSQGDASPHRIPDKIVGI